MVSYLNYTKMPIYPQSTLSFFMQHIRVLIAVLAWAALILQLGLMIAHPPEGVTYPGVVIMYFSYFTILSNLLVASSLTFVNHRYFATNFTHGAITVYITIVSLVYILFLHDLWNPQGWHLIADILLHYVIPTLYVLHWGFAVDKGDFEWFDSVRWLKFPFIYLLYVIVRGFLTEVYPYPFLDVGQLGFLFVIRNIFIVGAAFWFVGMVVVGIDKAIGRPEMMGSLKDQPPKKEILRKK